jgi:hypothetical protein
MKKIVLMLMIVGMMLGSLSGCASKVKPEATLITFLDAFKGKQIIDYPSLFDKDMDMDITANPFGDPESPSEITDKMMEMMLSYEYEVIKTEIAEDGLSATVTVQFTTVNIGSIFTTFMLDYIAKAFEMAFSGATEAEMNQLAVTLFLEASKDAPKDKLSTVDVKMVLVDKKWLIHIDGEDISLFDAMMGGLITTMKNFQPVE